MNRTRIVACAAGLLALLLVGAGATQAFAAGGGGRAQGQGATPLFSFAFDVTQRGADPRAASGSFRAEVVQPGGTLVAPQGPATCVDVRGSTVGFLYPLVDATRPTALPFTSILVTARDGGPGRPDAVGFVGPLPTAAFGGQCAPGLAPFPVTSGDVVVTPN